jgi:2-polyprenyl-6-methoxyphenol hydroxylase-like FAD-dependent oxidoreductase
MTKLNILIVGASIAGPTAAYWFAKAGANVTIIERFPKMRTNGQNVDIRTVGLNVMRKMKGMESAVRAKRLDLEGISFVSGGGQLLGTIKPTGNPDLQSLVSEYEIFRGDLAQILFDLTKNDKSIRYVFGEQVVSMHQSESFDGPVTVEFANGLPTAQYDLVVACDGATSRTRSIGLGCDTRDHMIPMKGWAAYFSVKQDLLEGSKLGVSYSAIGGRFIAIGPDPGGVSRVVLMCFQPSESPDAMLPFREAMKKGDDSLKQFIAQHYRGAGWKTEEVVNGLIEADDFYSNEIVQVKLPSLYKGRFVLVGDAGYASSVGTGTSLAIAGAYVLAGEVCKKKGDLAAALSSYEQQMRPIIDDLQAIPPLMFTILAPQTSWGLRLRNSILGFIIWTRILEFGQKYFARAFASSDKYNLQEYKWCSEDTSGSW